MNKNKLVIIVFSVILLIVVTSLATFGVLNHNMMQENEILTAQLINTQKELAVAQDEAFIAEESLRIETDRHLVTQRELEEANAYIDMLIDEKYSVDYEVTNAEIEIIAKTEELEAVKAILKEEMVGAETGAEAAGI